MDTSIASICQVGAGSASRRSPGRKGRPQNAAPFGTGLALAVALLGFCSSVEAATARLSSFAVIRPPRADIVQGGSSYDFQIRFENAGFAAPIVTSSNARVIPGFSLSGNNVTVLSKRVTVSRVSQPVSVRLTANWGGRTRTLNLTVSPPRPGSAPVQSWPRNDFYEYRDTTSVGWDQLSGASEYQICLKREGVGGCPNNGTDGIAATTSSTGIRFPVSRFRGQKTLWFLRGCNPLGCSPYSSTRRIFVTLQHAALRSPANSATLRPGTVSFSWSPVSGANAYQVIVGNKAYKVAGGSTSSYLLKISSDMAGQPIGWYVTACNSATGCSLAGDQRVFYVRP